MPKHDPYTYDLFGRPLPEATARAFRKARRAAGLKGAALRHGRFAGICPSGCETARLDVAPRTARILNLGGGVQSTTVAYLALDGLVTRPDLVVFADTGNEPPWVLTQVRRVLDDCKHAGIETAIVHRPATGEAYAEGFMPAGQGIHVDLRASATGEDGGHYTSIPFHSYNEDGDPMMTRRQCTGEYKIRPMEQMARAFIGVAPGRRVPVDAEPDGAVVRPTVIHYIGISTDEAGRISANENRWGAHAYPLIERRMSRDDCVAYLVATGRPVPRKSSCVICPFHSLSFWLELRADEPDLFAEAVAFDQAVRAGGRLFSAPVYLSPLRIPLSELPASAGACASLPFFEEAVEGGSCGAAHCMT